MYIKGTIFWDVVPRILIKSTDVSVNALPPSSRSKTRPSKYASHSVPLWAHPPSSSTPKVDEARSSQSSLNFYQIRRHQKILVTVHNHHENHEAHKYKLNFTHYCCIMYMIRYCHCLQHNFNPSQHCEQNSTKKYIPHNVMYGCETW